MTRRPATGAASAAASSIAVSARTYWTPYAAHSSAIPTAWEVPKKRSTVAV